MHSCTSTVGWISSACYKDKHKLVSVSTKPMRATISRPISQPELHTLRNVRLTSSSDEMLTLSTLLQCKQKLQRMRACGAA